MALHTMSCDIFIEKWLIWLPGRGAVWETDHSNSQAVKSPIIWWMVYLPNRWGETCIEIERAGFFGTCPGHGNRLEIWIIRLCSPSGSKLEMNSSCEWFSAANNAARRVYHPWLSCSRGGKKKWVYRLRGFTPVWIPTPAADAPQRSWTKVWRLVINPLCFEVISLCAEKKLSHIIIMAKTIICSPLFPLTGGPCFCTLMYHKWTI